MPDGSQQITELIIDASQAVSGAQQFTTGRPMAS